jgi:hypothetical protein
MKTLSGVGIQLNLKRMKHKSNKMIIHLLMMIIMFRRILRL